MNNQIKKSTFGAATPSVEIENNSNLILSDGEPIVKCSNTTKLLTDEQKLTIRKIWFRSHWRCIFVDELKKLQFCTYSVALKYLKEQEFINDEQYYDLMEEVV